MMHLALYKSFKNAFKKHLSHLSKHPTIPQILYYTMYNTQIATPNTRLSGPGAESLHTSRIQIVCVTSWCCGYYLRKQVRCTTHSHVVSLFGDEESEGLGEFTGLNDLTIDFCSKSNDVC